MSSTKPDKLPTSTPQQPGAPPEGDVTPLRRVQEDFQDFLLTGSAGVESHVIGTGRVPIATRLGIYGDAYRLRLIEALQANYPVLAQLLGEMDFEALGTAYVQAHPSRVPSIRFFGDALPVFLSDVERYASVPLLADLARWEWAVTEVFDAADATPLDPAVLSQVPAQEWSELQFDWHPSIRRLDLRWNAPQIWKAATQDAERPEAQVTPIVQPWLLWRRELQIYFRSLPSAEAAALDAARSGVSFGELCVLLCEYFTEDEAPARAAGFLREWTQAGLIVAVHPTG